MSTPRYGAPGRSSEEAAKWLTACLDVSRWAKENRMKHITRFLGFVVAAFSLLAVQNAQGQLVDSPWPMFQHDPLHTGRTTFVGPASNEVAWTSQEQGVVCSTPTVGSDGTIYVLSGDGSLYALYPGGAVKWKYHHGDPFYTDGIRSPTLAADGTIYFASGGPIFSGTFLFAISRDGTLKWKYPLASFPSEQERSSPALAQDGTVYVGSESGVLFAVNPNGTLKWQFKVDDDVNASPAIATSGTIYFRSDDGYLYALNPNGTLKWRFQLGPPGSSTQRSSPSVGSDGTVYIGSSSSLSPAKVFALNPDGSLKWSCCSGYYMQGGHGTPAIGSDGTLYVPDGLGLWAIDKDGSRRWTFSLGNHNYTSAIVDGEGTIYCSSKEEFFAVSPDGALKWMYDPPESIYSSPAIDSSHRLYFGAGRLYALAKPSTGETPDLAIAAITFDSVATSVGGRVQIRAAVQDLSGQAAARCQVTFYYDSTSNLIGTSSVYVPTGQTGYGSVVWNTQNFEVRDYPIIAVISDSDPPESDTSNNEAHASYRLYATIQSRIDSAQIGDTVCVDPGTYYECITLKNDVRVWSIRGPEETILDGQQECTVVSAPELQTTAVLDGFTITNGNGTWGGGVSIYRGGATIRNNAIVGNTAFCGGGVYMIGSLEYPNPIIANNLIMGNDADLGDAIYANNSWARLLNNTVVNNGAGSGDGTQAIGFYSSSPTIKNCIVWGNGDDLSGTAVATYSDIEDGDPGTGNISADPKFVDPANGDFHLQAGSPCIDTGDPGSPADPDGTRADMGAYYYQPAFLLVPSVAHAPGANSTQWRTNLVMANRNATSVSAVLTLYSYETGATMQVRNVALAAGETVEWEDVLVSLFGLSASTSNKGSIHISSNHPPFASSRTFNQGTTGTFGQYCPALKSKDAITDGQTGTILQLKKTSAFRSNLGVQNLGASSVSVAVKLYNGGGVQVGSTLTRSIAGNAYYQWDDVFAKAGAAGEPIAYATVKVGTPGGRVWAYGSVVDNATGDPTTIPALTGPPAGPYLVPSVAHAPGTSNTQWRSNLAVANRNATLVSVTLTLYSYETGATMQVRNAALAAGETVEWEDVLVTLFGYPTTASVKGSILIASTAPVLATSRTFNQAAAGTFGQYCPALESRDAITDGQAGTILQLKKTSAFRSNLGVQNLSASSVSVAVKLYNGGGVQVGSTLTRSIAGNAYYQWDDVFARAGAAGEPIAYATVEVLTEGGRVWAYGSVVDNATGDPTTIPVLVN
jgi:outer membrane protein assembly factor BamB